MASKSTNKALIVGVSQYPTPIPTLPAVAADVREIAKLLKSPKGTFSAAGTTVLVEKAATRKAILAGIKDAFSAGQDDTVFVYLAGHGDIENGEYYFISHDADCSDLAATAVPLKDLKRLFDASKSKRVFLWLDCCHSGGILKPRTSNIAMSEAVLKRTIEVVRGEGHVIIAACTAEQSAYEDSRLGHGLFTHALLRGLKGEAESHGEVTASSLYDFIDRQIGSNRQRPMFFGHTTGRIVLMHDGSGPGGKASVKSKTSKSVSPKKAAKGGTGGRRVSSSDNWVLLGDQYFEAQRVHQGADGAIQVEIPTRNAEEDAAVRRLKSPRHGSENCPFAYRNDASDVSVTAVSSESTSKGQVWTVRVAPVEQRPGFHEAGSYSEGGRTFSSEDIAQMRARLILLNERPPVSRDARSFGGYSLVENAVTGGRHSNVRCPFPAVFANDKSRTWRQRARLAALYSLKSTGTVEEVLELSLGPVKGNKMSVKFRGRCHRIYSNEAPAAIECSGECPLN